MAPVRGCVENAYQPSSRAVLGRVIANRYLVEELCESTPAATSYRATHLKHDRALLVRILPECPAASQDACRRALAAAERASALQTPHLGRTLDVGLVEGRYPFLVYEYTKGRSLAALLEQAGPFPIERLLPVAQQLAGALETAHEAGVLHGRLQLEHCWLESPPSRPVWLRLLGFGLSELPELDADATSSGVFPSTAHSRDGAAPVSPLGLRADIHGFGACLYQLASGKPLGWAALHNVGLDASFGALPWTGTAAVERGLSLLIQRCLYLAPHRAYRGAAEISLDLERLSGGDAASLPTPLRPPVTAIHVPPPRARVAVGQPKVIVKGG